MSKGIYGGVDSKACKIKKMFAGVSDVARKVKKGYVGVNNVAMLFFGKGELSYYKKATNLSVARAMLAATSVGDYALFAGGQGTGSPSYKDTVNAYNKSLTRSTPTKLSAGRRVLSGGTVGGHALFAGGNNNNSLNNLDIYNTSLTYTASNLPEKGENLVNASIGDYVLFGGRYYSGQSKFYNTVYAYDNSLTCTYPTTLSYAGGYEAASNGIYAVFGQTSAVNAYDSALTRTIATKLKYDVGSRVAVSAGSFILFAGGTFDPNSNQLSDHKNYVEVYNASLTRSTADGLSVSRFGCSATEVEGYALIAGGESSSPQSAVDAYDESLVHTTTRDLSIAKGDLSATTLGNYALFGGGQSQYSDPWTYSNVVDVYQVI